MHVAPVTDVGECGVKVHVLPLLPLSHVYIIPHVGRQRVHISGKTGHSEALCPVGHEL